jgi:hypothetical protein
LPYVCRICREEFDTAKPAKETGARAGRCPKGHALSRVNGLGVGFVIGLFTSFGLFFIGGAVNRTFLPTLDVGPSAYVFVSAAVYLVIIGVAVAGIFSARRMTKAGPPVDKLAQGEMGGVAGYLVGLASVTLIAFFR